MRIYLTRHAESEGNVNKAKYFEKLDCDIEITLRGESQAIKAANNIMDLNDHFVHKNDPDYMYPSKNPPYTFNLFCSSYKRSKQTANIIHDTITSFEGYQIRDFKETPLLREREWGSLRDIVESNKEDDSHFNFFYRPTGGESFADCFNRVALFHQWLLLNTTQENNIVVAHGEFNKLYLMYLLGWSIEEFDKYKNPKNCEVFVVDYYKLSSMTPVREKSIKH